MSETNDNHVAETVTSASETLKAAVTALTAEEARLTTALATVKAQRQSFEKALQAATGEKPARRRGRPRKTETAPTA